jgi:uncharacterized membrane protein
MIAVEADPVHLLFMAVASLLISIVVVYFSDFKGVTETFIGLRCRSSCKLYLFIIKHFQDDVLYKL